MRPVSAAFLAATPVGYEHVTRLTLLDEDLRETEELTGEDGFVISASVAMDRLRTPRRTAQIELVNENGSWSSTALTDQFLSQRFKLQMGMRLASGVELVTLGIFMVDVPAGSFAVDSSTLTIDATDLWKTQRNRKLRETLTFEKGMRLDQVVADLAVRAGFPRSRMVLDDGYKTLEADLTIDRWAVVGDELADLVDVNALELYLDADGKLVLAPAPVSGTTGDSVYDFRTDEQSVLVTITKSLNDLDLYNAVGVEAESANGDDPVYAEARDLNPLSPAYNPFPGMDPAWPLGGGPLGDRLMVVEHTSKLASEAAAYALAQRRLFEYAMVEERYELGTAPVMHLEPGDVVLLTHAESETDKAELLVDAVTIDPTPGSAMTLDVKRLRRLTA